jgi:acyl-CoA thioester hydrolase
MPVSPRPHIVHEFVRWGDVDVTGIIRYDAYGRLFSFGEGELLRAAGLTYQEVLERHALMFPRRVMHAEFLTPARLDERLTIATGISAVGTTSITLDFDIRAADDTVRATGYLVVVAVSAGEMTKQPIPADVIERLSPYRVGGGVSGASR